MDLRLGAAAVDLRLGRGLGAVMLGPGAADALSAATASEGGGNCRLMAGRRQARSGLLNCLGLASFSPVRALTASPLLPPPPLTCTPAQCGQDASGLVDPVTASSPATPELIATCSLRVLDLGGTVTLQPAAVLAVALGLATAPLDALPDSQVVADAPQALLAVVTARPLGLGCRGGGGWCARPVPL